MVTSPRPKVLIVGASGQVGFQLLADLYKQNKYELSGTYNSYNISSTISYNKHHITLHKDLILEKDYFDVIYIPAYPTNVDLCETNKTADIFNYQLKLFLQYQKNAKIIFFSTDYIFDDGIRNEIDFPYPLNRYGLCKLQMEHYILANHKDSLIIRTSGVYGAELQRKNFVYRIISSYESQVPLDQYNCPTYCPDLVSKTIKLVEENSSGIYHIAGPDYINRYVFAKKICRVFDIDDEKIWGIKTFEQEAKRPSVNLVSIKNLQDKTINVDDGLCLMRDQFNPSVIFR